MSKRTLMQLAFENVSVQVPIVAEDQSGSVDIDEKELTEAHQDALQIDNLITTAVVMESAIADLKPLIEQGGLSYPAAKALESAFESLSKCCGIEHDKTISMESFQGGRISRQTNTVIALEDFGETVRRLVRKILAWIKQVAIACYEVIERIIRGANAVIDKARELQGAASGLIHQKTNAEKLSLIEKSSLTSFFNQHGQPMMAAEIVRRYQEYCRDVNAAFDAAKLYQPSVKALEQLDRFVEAHGEKDIDLKVVEGFAADACDELIRGSLHGFQTEGGNESTVMVKALPFGNAKLKFSFSKGVELPDRNVGFHSVIETFADEKAPGLQPLRPQDVMNLTSVIISEMGRGIYRDSKHIRAGINDIMRRVERQSYALSDRQRELGATTVPSLTLVRNISETCLKLTRLLYSYSGITNRRLLDYARLSLKAYEKASIS